MGKLKKILLIDDDKVNNYPTEELLLNLSIAEEIHVELNGKKALGYLLANCDPERMCPELIIFDHHMPVMDGMEFIKALNEMGFVNREAVVFILLAIDSKQEDIEEFQRLGVQEFTLKPLSEKFILDCYFKYFAADPSKEHKA